MAAGGSGSAMGGATSGSGGASGGSVGGGTPGGVPDSVIAQATKAADLVAAWKLGWNLGNSLDANGCGAAGAETCWGNPMVTEGMLSYVASLGFNVVRIPVTWSEHLGPGPSYAVDPGWMSRVDAVVNYAIKAGLSVIVNVHHDGADDVKGTQWLDIVDANGQVTETHTAAVVSEFNAVWKQIATHFKDYDNRVVFESMNEIHQGYGNPEASWYDFVNQLNQAFVTTVRATGGKNTNRFLVVPGYNTNIDQTVQGFKAPTDSVSNHLILSYHYYDPYKFTLSNETHTWGAAYANANDGTGNFGQEDHVLSQFDKIKASYIDKGLPVIMGEYGAAFQTASSQPYRRYWVEYVTKAAHDRGIAPVLWDAGQELVNRENLSLRYTDLHQALLRATTSSYSINQIALPK